jgi:hypothetical protein
MNFIMSPLSVIRSGHVLASANGIFVIVFVILWIASALAGNAKKKEQRSKPTIIPRQAPPRRPRPIARPPLPRPIPTPTPPLKMPTPVWFPPAPPTPSEMPVPRVVPPGTPSPLAVPSLAPVGPAMPRPSAPVAASIHRWLRPATLRSQFILTEIFRPPLALRDEFALPR